MSACEPQKRPQSTTVIGLTQKIRKDAYNRAIKIAIWLLTVHIIQNVTRLRILISFFISALALLYKHT